MSKLDTVPSPDIYLMAIVATAHVGRGYCDELYDLAWDDPAEAAELSPAQAEHILRSVGCRCEHWVDDGGHIPPTLWAAALQSKWVLVHMVRKDSRLPARWFILDWCHDHAPRLLLVPVVGGPMAMDDPVSYAWTGHALYLPDGPIAQTHQQRGYPPLN